MDNKEIIENNEYSKHSLEEILSWIDSIKDNTKVQLEKIKLQDCSPWFYDKEKGELRNKDGSFFQVTGIEMAGPDKTIHQPIIIQNEIGFLGIIACKINGVWHYLMQAKIEPGNVNVVQVSPTIQATKSNFEAKHGGRVPAYLDFFLNMKPEQVLVDQIQSEQSSRFLGKRNRNVIIMSDEELEEKKNFRWLTLSQIKALMHYDNLVNMDTRTVISCIPFVLLEDEKDLPFAQNLRYKSSVTELNRKTIISLYNVMNNYKMFTENRVRLLPLHELKGWEIKDNGVFPVQDYSFEVIYCNVLIEGREVTSWNQPLVASRGMGTIGLICCNFDGMFKFLVKPRAEVGCRDFIEIGPTIQQDYAQVESDEVSKLFWKKLERGEGVITDAILSEEGGRFYQEQNRNVIIEIGKDELSQLPEGYVWSDYGTLNILMQVNNVLNIQLRNMLSFLEI